MLLEPFAYGYMVNAIWVSALVGALCAFLSAFLDAQGLEPDRRRAQPRHRARRRGRLHPRPALRARRVPVGRARGGGDPRPRRHHPAAPGRGDRRRLHRLLRARPVHDLDPADIGEHPDHHARQRAGDHPGRHDPARADRRRRARDPDAEMARLPRGVLRRDPRAHGRPAARPHQGAVLRPARRRHRRGAADRRRLPRGRDDHHARRHRLPADRPLRPADPDRGRHRRRLLGARAPISASSSTARPAASSSC